MAAAGEAPADGEGWAAAEICSHVLGDPQDRFIDGIRRGLDQDGPVVIGEIGLSQMTREREAMTAAQLAAAAASEYAELASFVGGLSEAKLARSVKAPVLEPFIGSDTMAIAQWAATLFDQHLPMHIDQLKALA